MAIKGTAYTKTTWAFEERPVASSKLNLWDDRIEAALELVHYLLNQAWGGGNGVVRTTGSEDLLVSPTTIPGLSVKVKPGYAFISHLPFRLSAVTETASVSPPASLARIDLVQARLDTWDVSIKIGTESASPSAPSADADCIALARLHLRAGMTAIKSGDDGVNGYISDVRAFV